MNGRVDPVKAAEPSKPRGSSSSKRPARISDEHQSKRSRPEIEGEQYAVFMPDPDLDAMIDPALMAPVDPMLGVTYNPAMPVTDVNAFSTPPQMLSTENSFSITNGLHHAIDPALDPALMNEGLFQLNTHRHDGVAAMNGDDETTAELQQNPKSKLPQLGLVTVGTPDVDRSFSPITAETSSAEIAIRSGGEEDTTINSRHTPRCDDHPGQEVQMDNAIQPATAEEVKPHHDRRHSSNATGTSPKQEIMSASSRRSSSQTSGNTHVAAGVEQSVVSGTGDNGHEVIESVVMKQEPDPNIKQEVADSVEDTVHIRRGSTAASSVSDVAADEEFARRLQMEEMGLRRRTSVRAP